MQGISPEAVKTFMEIEFPENGSIALAAEEVFSTIGEFYSAILDAFKAINPPLSLDKQLEGSKLKLFKIKSLDDVQKAIELIKQQGEGSKASPEDTNENDLAHYYRFKEIHDGKRLKKIANSGKWEWVGDYPFPDNWPMAMVPKGGYKRDQVADNVWKLLSEFDSTYTSMLKNLQSAWDTGDKTHLNSAVGAMRDMENSGRANANFNS